MERYFAREENGKGYLFDREFSEKVPIAVDNTYQQSKASADRFNEETKTKRRLNEYVIYYYEQDGTPEGCTVFGSDRVIKTVKWVKSVGGIIGQILKKGKDFNEDHEDVVDVTSSYIGKKC